MKEVNLLIFRQFIIDLSHQHSRHPPISILNHQMTKLDLQIPSLLTWLSRIRPNPTLPLPTLIPIPLLNTHVTFRTGRLSTPSVI